MTEVAVHTVILVVTVVKEMSAETEVTEKKRIKLWQKIIKKKCICGTIFSKHFGHFL